MVYCISLAIAAVIMVIGLLINDYWYKKQDKKLSDTIIPLANEDLFIIILVVVFAIIILLFPLLNILIALSINIGLFIKGVE